MTANKEAPMLSLAHIQGVRRHYLCCLFSIRGLLLTGLQSITSKFPVATDRVWNYDLMHMSTTG